MVIRQGEVVSRVDRLGAKLQTVGERNYNLKLSSKRLKSGKYQVKFSASIQQHKQLYGYVLVDADETLREVVMSITNRLDRVKQRDTIHHINLYAVGQNIGVQDNFIVFDS
jgi:hypothetical protein